MITDMTGIRDEDSKVHLTAQETFTLGRAAQVRGETSLPEFARTLALEGARRVLDEADQDESTSASSGDEAERSECAGASAPAGEMEGRRV